MPKRRRVPRGAWSLLFGRLEAGGRRGVGCRLATFLEVTAVEAQGTPGVTPSWLKGEWFAAVTSKLLMAENNRLKAARVLRGLTQLQLAERIGKKEIEVSRFFAAKEEQKWKDLEKNGEWLHAMVTAHPDTAFILRELANYYQWWIENPKKRRENLAASIGHWLRNEARRQRGSNGNNRAKSLPVPTEPGKYDGIGVTYSAFEE